MEKVTNNALIWSLVLIVALMLCSVIFSTDVAYADSGVSITTSDYYVNRNTYDTTQYYNEYGVSNNTVQYSLSNDFCSFDLGASVLKNDIDTLVFNIKLNNPSTESFSWFGGSDFVWEFTVFECSRDSTTATGVLDFLLFCIYDDDIDKAVYFYAFKRLEYSDVKMSVEGCTSGIMNTSYNSLMITELAFFFDVQGYGMLGCFDGENLGILPTEKSNMHIAITPSSPYTRYFVRSSMQDDDENVRYADSSVVSSYDVLKNMKEYDGWSELSSSCKDEAESIVYDFSTEKVKIVYLERVGETPFAVEKNVVVGVPVVGGSIYPSDVANSLGLSSLNVMQSVCQKFEYDADTQVYRAKYLKSVYLCMKTASGQNGYYYLDCNNSFYDYYHQFVASEVFDEGCFEYFFNDLLLSYPECQKDDEYQLYGYWGFASLPKEFTFSQLIFEVFDAGQANYEGVINVVQTTSYLSADAYKTLLEDYGYNWLEQAWNLSVGFFAGYECYNYSFYVDSGVTQAMIAHNGADSIYDNASRSGVLARKTAETIGNEASELWEMFKDFLRNVNENAGKIMAIIAGIIVLLLATVIISSLAFGKSSSKYYDYKNNKEKNKQLKEYNDMNKAVKVRSKLGLLKGQDKARAKAIESLTNDKRDVDDKGKSQKIKRLNRGKKQKKKE